MTGSRPQTRHPDTLSVSRAAPVPAPSGLSVPSGLAGTPTRMRVATRAVSGRAEPEAHAIFDIGPLTATKGVTFCDLLAGDEVWVLPDLAWDTIAPDLRCPTCSAALQR